MVGADETKSLKSLSLILEYSGLADNEASWRTTPYCGILKQGADGCLRHCPLLGASLSQVMSESVALGRKS
jgi:hypothetical protein